MSCVNISVFLLEKRKNTLIYLSNKTQFSLHRLNRKPFTYMYNWLCWHVLNLDYKLVYVSTTINTMVEYAFFNTSLLFLQYHSWLKTHLYYPMQKHILHTHSLLKPYLRLNLHVFPTISLMNYDLKHLKFTILIIKVFKN